MRTPREEVYCIEGFTERINEAFTKSNLSIAEVCRRTRMERSTFYNYLSGNIPSAYNLMKIAKAMNVSTDWLLGLSKARGLYE